MSTLVFCTAYASQPHVWTQRYRLWLDAILEGPLKPDHILLVDDGSPCLPDWPDTHILCGDSIGEAFSIARDHRLLLFHFNTHLGRRATMDFPGWHRSFVFGALYGEALGAERVIHIESDAFVISARAHDWLLAFEDGWGTAWSTRYNTPEAAIQVAAGSGLRSLAEFARQPYAPMVGEPHELMLPFTTAHRGLLGDRYGETRALIPAGADYAAQISTTQDASYLWGRGRDAPAGPPAASITLHFCVGGNGLSALRSGWADAEADMQWMLGEDSTMLLPALGGSGDAVLRLHVFPCLSGAVLPCQRLSLEVGGVRLKTFEITQSDVVGCRIPARLLSPHPGTLLRLIHPDAATPASLVPGSADRRLLSISVAWMTLDRWN